jgi:hypothetical protein
MPQIRRGELNVQTLVATLATADLTARGSWRFTEPQSGAITYDAAVTSLRPWGPYIPLVGDPVAAGSVRAAGTVTGTLDRLRLAGMLAATEVQSGEWRAQSAEAEYDITRGAGPLPVMVVNATARA